MGHERELALLRRQLLRYAMLRLRNRHHAEDAVQDALLAALEGIGSFSGRSSLRTWVGGILKHKIADRLRASACEELISIEPDLPGSDPEERYARQRFCEAVEAGLDRLPGRAARVFMLREVLGLAPAEVSRELAISLPNCWVTLHRVKARLRELVPDEI